MPTPPPPDTYDYVIIGSGFGGSVSALRLTEKGYSVLVLEQGRRFRDEDFAKSTWDVRRYLWLPAARCFGILQISPFRDVTVLHGAGVGGGSLGYANVLMEPSDDLFQAPAWRHLADWKTVLRPHYATARRMLGITRNPRLWAADHALCEVAEALGRADTFDHAPVAVYFGPDGGDTAAEAPDPYFGGEGPPRRPCVHCGACMVGCRHNAKNTLVKNYLYLAEKWGARVLAEAQARDIRPLPGAQPDGARYEVIYRRSTAWRPGRPRRVRARSVVVAAGTLGTLTLLFRCRDVTRALPALSPRLGEAVRTNSESLLGAISRDDATDYSKGLAITSYFHADDVTTVEPVRFPDGSDLMRYLSAPLVEASGLLGRLGQTLAAILRRPGDLWRAHAAPGWARRTTILLLMQKEDTRLRLRLGRSALRLWQRGLVSAPDPDHKLPAKIAIGHAIARRLAEKVNGAPAGTLPEGVFNIPMTAHILGGCPMAPTAAEGVVGLDCQAHHYPGLYVVDGSIMPANPGVNPSLTITALAEYAMSRIPGVPGRARPHIGADSVLEYNKARHTKS